MSIATTQSSRTRPSPAALGYGAAVIALVTIPGYVQGQTRAGAIVSARSGISSSPYGNTGNGKSTLTVTIGVAPVVILEQETGTIALGGDINHTEYAKRYSSKTDYSTYLRTNHKLDGQTTLGTSFNYSNAKVTNSDGLNSATFVSDNPDLPAILDPSLANDVGSRRSNFQASASLSHQFSARQSVSLSTSASAVRYSSGSASSEYNFASVRGNYSHAVSEVLSLGAGVSAS